MAQTPDGGLYGTLRPITDHLGLACDSQRNRVLRDRVMAPRVRTILMTGLPREKDLRAAIGRAGNGERTAPRPTAKPAPTLDDSPL